jgi:signal transduction histidine kinase/ligand-binding sensor domain-containing protein/DNA-binding NarL/FixJ family response regulator
MVFFIPTNNGNGANPSCILRCSRFLSCYLLLLIIHYSGIAQQGRYVLETIPLDGQFEHFAGQCILQDSDGFMWFGSSNGLYRYHGTGVRLFQREPDNGHSLSNNSVVDLFEDSQGFMWVGTQGGLNRFDKRTETFKRFYHINGDSGSIAFNPIVNMVEDSHHRLWVGTLRGLSVFERQTETFKNYAIHDDELHKVGLPIQVNRIHVVGDGFVWINTSNGVFRFDIQTERIEKATKINDDILEGEVITHGPNGAVFACTKGIYRYDKSVNRYELLYPSSTFWAKKEFAHGCFASTNDAFGNVWFRLYDGIYCYNSQLDFIYAHRFTELNADYTKDWNLMKDLYADNQGNIWFYTRKGINRLVRHQSNFKVFATSKNESNWVNCLCAVSSEMVLLGTKEGLYAFHPHNGKAFTNNTCRLHNAFPAVDIASLHVGQDGRIWAGTLHNGFYGIVLLDNGKWQVKRFLPGFDESIGLDKAGLFGVQNIFHDAQGHLWLSIKKHHPLHFYDEQRNWVFRMVDNPSSKSKLPTRGYVFHQSGDTLWVIGHRGLYKAMLPITELSAGKAVFANVIECSLVEKVGTRVEIPPFVNSALVDGAGTVWVANDKAGLMRLTKAMPNNKNDHGYVVKNYKTNEGLPGLRVMSILPDEKGNLWMGTSNGLAKFNVAAENFESYFVRHGLPDNEFNPGSAVALDNGQMLFGTIAGVVAFFPDSISSNQFVAPVAITEIKVNNKVLHPDHDGFLKESITMATSIVLPHNQNNVSFEYAILNYGHPEYNRFRYNMEGLTTDWVDMGSRTHVDFAKLSPGSYTFVVTGSNNDGLWNPVGKSIRITIQSPHWLRWYAWLFYVCSLVGIVWWYHRYHANRNRLLLAVELERMEKEKMVELDRLKSRFFANVSHEFRTPLTLIRGPLDDLYKQTGPLVSVKRELLHIMRRNTIRLQQLIDQLLDIAKLETGKLEMQLTKGDLMCFVRTIFSSFLSLAESKNIHFQFRLDDADRTVFYDADKVEKILINLVSNAFKFTPPNGTIVVDGQFEFKADGHAPQYVVFNVSDTGVGIAAEKLDRIFDRFYRVNDTAEVDAIGTGLGLALTKELVDLYHGQVTVESQEGVGSTFTVRLPVANELFPDALVLACKSVHEKELLPGIADDGFSGMTSAGQQLDADADKPLVLVVEDNEDLRHYMMEILGGVYNVACADNGKTGLEMALEAIPDLVVTDWMMPQMNGLEMCRLLKENEKTNHIPVVMLTAKADRESKLDSLERGADDYLVKPFDAEELLVRIKNLIVQRRRLREKFQHRYFEISGSTIPVDGGNGLVTKLFELLEANYANPCFKVEDIGRDLNLSRAQLFRKLHALTGQTPNELLRMYRIKQAAALIKAGQNNITGIMYEVGFRNTSHFAVSFKKYIGKNPSEYRDEFIAS